MSTNHTDPYGGYDLGEYRYAAAKVIKPVIGARVMGPAGPRHSRLLKASNKMGLREPGCFGYIARPYKEVRSWHDPFWMMNCGN
jgi:hypothetical protein